MIGKSDGFPERSCSTERVGSRQACQPKTETTEGTVVEYVTAMIGGQLFGLLISRVQDVFMPERLTPRAAVVGRDCRRAQSARPHRHRGRHARPARAARTTTTASRRWRSGSTCAANPVAC